MGIAFIVIIVTINLKLFFLLHTVSGKLEESSKFFFFWLILLTSTFSSKFFLNDVIK